MEKIVFMSFALTMIYLSAFADCCIHSKPWGGPCQNPQVVNVCRLKDHDLNEIMQGHCPEMALEFSAQTTLPINFFIKGDLINLVKNEESLGQIEIKQTFYARCVGDELILSTDLIDWKPFLEFITGTSSVALCIQDGQPSITFGAEANRRS